MQTKESMVVINIQQNMLSTYFWLRTGGAMKFLIVSLRKSTMVCTPNTRLLTGSSVNYIRQKIKVLKSLIASTVKNMVLIICELNQE